MENLPDRKSTPKSYEIIEEEGEVIITAKPNIGQVSGNRDKTQCPHL